MDVFGASLAVLVFIFGFVIGSDEELFVGLPTTLDLSFDWVDFRDVLYGLLSRGDWRTTA